MSFDLAATLHAIEKTRRSRGRRADGVDARLTARRPQAVRALTPRGASSPSPDEASRSLFSTERRFGHHRRAAVVANYISEGEGGGGDEVETTEGSRTRAGDQAECGGEPGRRTARTARRAAMMTSGEL